MTSELPMPADFNPPEVSTPALGWGIRFHFLPHALWNFFVFFVSGRVRMYISTVCDCISIAYSV